MPQPESHQKQDVGRLTTHLAADRDLDPGPVAGDDHLLYQSENPRMGRLVEMGDVLVDPVDSKRILHKIICTDAEEINLVGDPVDDQGDGWNLDHDAHRHPGRHLDPLGLQLLANLRDNTLG